MPLAQVGSTSCVPSTDTVVSQTVKLQWLKSMNMC
jgi:hypothetical protein